MYNCVMPEKAFSWKFKVVYFIRVVIYERLTNYLLVLLIYVVEKQVNV